MRLRCAALLFCAAMLATALQAAPAAAQTQDHSTTQAAAIPQSARITPPMLAKMIRSGQAPPIFEVGFHTLYQQGHIKGATYAGPAGTPAGRSRLKEATAHLNHNELVVIYCGCCPWLDCPNIRPAYEMLHKLGFTKVKALYIPHNFGTDWVAHGYPTIQG